MSPVIFGNWGHTFPLVTLAYNVCPQCPQCPRTNNTHVACVRVYTCACRVICIGDTGDIGDTVYIALLSLRICVPSLLSIIGDIWGRLGTFLDRMVIACVVNVCNMC
jgi:hypothetical protein